jgi:uncharacterized protein YkwD
MGRAHAIRIFAALVGFVALVSAVLVITAPPAAAAVGNCVPDPAWGTKRTDYHARLIALVNAHRQGLGLATLRTSTSLQNAAEWKALHMAKYRYMTHNDPAPPVARNTRDRLEACAYPVSHSGWAENIAYGYTSPEAVMQAWLNSSGHRRNIENPSYRTIGVGAAVSGGSSTVYWAQTFGTWTGDASAAAPTPTNTPAATATATQTPSATATPPRTPTPAPTAAPTSTVSPTPAATATPAPVPTPWSRNRWWWLQRNN